MSFEDISLNGEVELTRHAEAREPSPELGIAAPVSTEPFPFLQLPREIRDLIYYFALTRLISPLTIPPENIYCYPSDVRIEKNSMLLWDKARPHHLFRVSHQICAEALEIFYSKFPMQFTHSLATPFINVTLWDNMSLENRSLVKSVGFTIIVTITKSHWYISQEMQIRKEVEDVHKWLPNIRRVDLAFGIESRPPRESQVKDVVDRLVQIVSPLQDVASLTLHRGGSASASQLMRIVVEVHEALTRCEQVKLCS